MNTNKVIKINNQDLKKDGDGFKIIEVNVSDSSESLYAVCTPIQKQ